MILNWPSETVLAEDLIEPWYQTGSNQVLDFHGDPIKADLVVLSDGNHHMALLPALKAFHREWPQIEDIFYATTPPYPIVQLLKTGAIRLGNLTLSVTPHIFISPPHVLDRLVNERFMDNHRLLAQNRGSVLLIPHGNPKQIRSVQDLMRDDVRLFISNPDTEQVSYSGYRQTLETMAALQGLDQDVFGHSVFGNNVMLGHCIHHREAPEAVFDGQVDVAIVYYHLALRYITIFPDHFDFIPLGGTRGNPEPPSEGMIAKIHMGLIGDGGIWGKRFIEFMESERVARIYNEHGLLHRGKGV
jgi:hypothetical protein